MTTLFIIMVCVAIPLIVAYCVAVTVPRWRDKALDMMPYVWGYVGLCWAVRLLLVK